MTLLMKRLMKKTTAPQRGFTLIEMVIVLAVISLLMLIMIPNLNHQREVAAGRQKDAVVEVVQNQAEMYTNETGQAATIQDLEDKGLSKQRPSRPSKITRHRSNSACCTQRING